VTEIASTRKIAYHRDRLEAYLRGERIFPASLELDLSTACNRHCPECPSTTSPKAHSLSMAFVRRLLGLLEGQTRGLLLSGGEPTMAPTFAPTLRLARERGFVDIVVVTNGTFLDEPQVADALLAHASAIRVSLYDWQESDGGLLPTLHRIEALRTRIERKGSALQIGVSALTTRHNAPRLADVAAQAASAGAHWIYFHPTCIRWEVGAPTRVDQRGVLAAIDALSHEQPDGFHSYVFRERYQEMPLVFHGYHAAHLLLVIGADGINYLGAEVKYQPQHAIANLTGKWRDGFLWDAQRLAEIDAVDSRTYPALGSRHRGVLYSHWIEQLREGAPAGQQTAPGTTPGLAFPHIL